MTLPKMALPAFLLFAPVCLTAQPVEILTYESISSRVRHGNPILAAARYRIAEALGRMTQSGRLSNPTLETALDHSVQSAEGRIEIGISQKFPLTNRLELEKEIGLKEVEAAEQEVRNVERLLVAEARTEFVKVLSIRERRELLGKQKALAGELATFISEASERGEISSLDAAQARLAALRITTEERRFDTEETTTLGQLRPLVGLAPGTPIQLSGNLPPLAIPSATSIDRPDLAALKKETAAANTTIALQQALRKDDIEASVFAAGERTEDAPEGLENEGIIGLKLKIALPFWNDNQGNIDAATARRDRKLKETEALTTGIRHETNTALTEMRQWSAIITELDATLLPLAKEQTDLLEQAYRQGQGDLQSVLSSREQTLELQASRLDATREFRLARIRYQSSY